MPAINTQDMLASKADILSNALFKYVNYDELFAAGKLDDESKETYGELVLEVLENLLKGKSLEEIQAVLSTLT